jgi:hypothetical protein
MKKEQIYQLAGQLIFISIITLLVLCLSSCATSRDQGAAFASSEIRIVLLNA